MEEKAYIKLSRKLLDWEWYTDIKTKVLFLHLLLRVNWKDGRFQGVEVPRGSFVSSIQKLSEETGLSVREVRTALAHLKATGEVTSKSHAKYSLFTVIKYQQYQSIDKQNDRQSDIQSDKQMTDERQADDKQPTSKRQAGDKRATTIEEEKEREEEKNKKHILCKQAAEELFERLWKHFPNKKGKGQVSLAAKQRLLKVGYEEMVRAIDRYILDLEKDSAWRKPQNGSTFFTSGYVDYLDEEWEKSHPSHPEPNLLTQSGTAAEEVGGNEVPEDEEELVGDDW